MESDELSFDRVIEDMVLIMKNAAFHNVLQFMIVLWCVYQEAKF